MITEKSWAISSNLEEFRRKQNMGAFSAYLWVITISFSYALLKYFKVINPEFGLTFHLIFVYLIFFGGLFIFTFIIHSHKEIIEYHIKVGDKIKYFEFADLKDIQLEVINISGYDITLKNLSNNFRFVVNINDLSEKFRPL